MRIPFSWRTMRALSRRANSTTRASSLKRAAHSAAWRDGCTSSRRTILPSDLEIILCLITRTSPSANCCPDCDMAASSSAATSSPGRTSPTPRTGRARISVPVSVMRGECLGMEVPTAQKLLRAGVALGGQQLGQVGGIVHVEADAGQAQHDAGLAAGLGGAQVGRKTIVAEAKREQVGGAAEHGVGATPVPAGDQHGTLRGGGRQHLLKILGLNQRDVAGNHQGAVVAVRDAALGGMSDGIAFAQVGGIGNDVESVALG